MGRWEFTFKEGRGWGWTVFDSNGEPLTYSGKYFDTIEACKVDAAIYGYSDVQAEPDSMH